MPFYSHLFNFRCFFISKLFLLLSLPIFGANKTVPFTSSTLPSSTISSFICPPDSFICPGQNTNNCIPLDWVNDGEEDCEDGADEKEEQQQQQQHINNGTEEIDPFLVVATSMGSPRMATIHQQTAQRLPPTMEMWLSELNSQLPTLFVRPFNSGQLLLQGCSIFSSHNTNSSVWSQLHTFLCELMAPSMRDQPNCLASSTRCPASTSFTTANFSSASTAIPCTLLANSLAHFQCLEANPSAQCFESALEMLAPLRQESEHWQAELQCNPVQTIAVITTQTDTTTQSQPIIEPWDALSMLARVEEFCQIDRRHDELAGDEEVDRVRAGATWQIWMKLCDRADVLVENAQCLRELAGREEAKCRQKPVQTAGMDANCALLDTFSRILGCAMRTLNELCPVEVQEAVIGVQEQLNDESIIRQCFQQQQKQGNNSSIRISPSNGESVLLQPVHPPCTAEQEEMALFCLAELTDLPGRLQRIPSLTALFSNHSIVDTVCMLFERYERCLRERVFGREARCAMNSPLNALARVGLSPICSTHYGHNNQTSIVSSINPGCLSSRVIAGCQGPVQTLATAVGAILHGTSNGAAHLCKAFYSLREAFQCGKRAAASEEQCRSEDNSLERKFAALHSTLNTIGLEEGCPEQPPPNLEALLVVQSSSPSSSSSNHRPSPVPQARPLPAELPNPSPHLPLPACPAQFQEQLQFCVQPLSAFQPHPLAVIKQPRQIAEACHAFGNFTRCQAGLSQQYTAHCMPLWARGMSAMFEFACGTIGNPLYLEVRQCLRRATGRPDLRQCVLAFSRASPTNACPSSRQLLDCSRKQIEEKCGPNAVHFVQEYVGRFAMALEPNCSLTDLAPSPAESIPVSIDSNCSSAQVQLVQRCAVPLGQLYSEIARMFQDGLTNLLRNMNRLAAIFQQGCSLSAQFRDCLGLFFASPHQSNCTISSCLLAAGAGICDQPDVGVAIDTNLGCVFRQVPNPQFGNCIRTHLGPLRQLNLLALRAALPNFVACIQPIVLQQCGPVPLNVLRVLAAKRDECPLKNAIDAAPLQQNDLLIPAICRPTMKISRQQCQQQYLLGNYQFVPGRLLLTNLNITFNGKQKNNEQQLEQFCADLDKVQQCERDTRPCDAHEPYGPARAMHALGTAICSSRVEFARQFGCLQMISESEEGRQCIASHFIVDGKEEEMQNNGQLCEAVNASSQCLALRIFADCGQDAMEFVFQTTNEYLAQMMPAAKCQLEAPVLTLQTSCSENQLIAYLECESVLDRFRPRPIALISNQSQWDEFCTIAQQKFRPCVQSLICRPEPSTSAALVLHETVCQREIPSRDQRQFGECLLKVSSQPAGQHCLDEFRTVDLLAKDSGEHVCVALNRLLQCTANMIDEQCGEEALLHVFDVYNGWVKAYHSDCSLNPRELSSEKASEKVKLQKPIEIQFSLDQTPIVLKENEIGNATNGGNGNTARTTTTTAVVNNKVEMPIESMIVGKIRDGINNGSEGTVMITVPKGGEQTKSMTTTEMAPSTLVQTTTTTNTEKTINERKNAAPSRSAANVAFIAFLLLLWTADCWLF